MQVVIIFIADQCIHTSNYLFWRG